ncbi:MAG: enoyl-CoA hydratase-related protein [Pseudomonadota bacterium]
MSIDYTIDQRGVAQVMIDRAERMNAIDHEAEKALENIWRTIEDDESIRLVVLTGSGEKAFCAGADMKSETGRSGLEYWTHGNPNGFGGLSLRESLTVPVIARVNGVATGGGLEMILGCDIVIAADHARFGLPEAKVGRLPLDGGMTQLQQRIPPTIAAGLMLTGRLMSAPQAAHFGLVNAVVPAANLDDEVQAWVRDVLACAPLSLKAIKQSLRRAPHLSPRESRALRSEALIRALTSADADEGPRAFREKRPPQWQGQ